MKHSLHQRRGLWLVLVTTGLLAVLSGCNLFQSSSSEWVYGEPVSFWMVNSSGTFMCPDLALADPLPPIDMEGVGDATFPEEGVLPIGEGQPASGDGPGELPPGEVDSSKLAGPYDVESEVPEGGDLNKHQFYVESDGALPDRLEVEITDSTISISGPPPWVKVSGTLEADGSFVATGRGSVAGRSDVAVSFTGTLTASGLAGTYEMGLEGRLPGGSITYTVEGQIALASGTVISESYDAVAGVSTQWVDLDGDGHADVIRTFDAAGKFIDEKALDMGSVIIFSHYDANTGAEWKWVDTNSDGKADVKRRYDRDGNLIEEQSVTGTVTATSFDASSGVTTEWVDLDGDGRPDVERRYDRDGSLIEERALQTEGTGTVISEGYDAVAGLTTQWVDLDGDGQADVVRRRDKDGNLVDERALDMGGVVTTAIFDASTGVETKWVDTNGDGVADVVRRYDADGNLINERGIVGTVIETDFSTETGVTTEWVDLDGDGRADVIRTYDREGFLIEERDVVEGDTGEVIGESLDQATGTTTYWVDTDADAQPNVELQCDAEGALVAQIEVEIAPTGLMGYVLSLTWIPICGGILFSIGILATVILTGGSGWDWRWTPTEKLESVKQFQEYLESLDGYDIQKICKQMEETIKAWEGGDIVVRGRDEAIKMWQTARRTKVTNKKLIIDYAMKGLIALLSHMQLASFLEFYLDVITGLLGVGFPGPLKFLKMLAKIKKWTKLIERIELIEKIKDKTDRLQKIQKLKEDLKAGTGDLLEVSMLETDTPAVAMGGSASFVAVIRGLLTSPVSTLRGCSPLVIFFALVGILGLLAIVLYALFGGFSGVGAPTEPAPIVEDAGAAVSVGDESEIEEVPPTLVPTPTLSPLDFVLMFGNFTEEQKAQTAIAYILDPEGDWIYSIANQIIILRMAQTDITGSLGVWLAMAHSTTSGWFNNSLFPCDTEIEGGMVICTETAEPMPEGNVLMLVMQLAGDIPLQDPDRFYTYAAVLDADGESSNNFQFQSPYDWDYFQGTDRWYSLDWDPTQSSWILYVSDVAKNEWSSPSKARAVIHGDVVVFFIPAEELGVDQPGYRLTAFGHDGTYALEQSSGDVTGADPTEALTIPPREEVLIEE